MSSNTYIAIDLGAGSGRVMLADFGETYALHEVHRFANNVQDLDGHQRWDFDALWSEIKTGITKAIAEHGEPDSIGADTWAVDYGVFDANGELLEQPVIYRDKRIEGQMEKVQAEMGADTIYDKTGIQFLSFNTLFQLYAQVNAGELPKETACIMMIPDMIHYYLTGEKTIEYTNATSTQMLDASQRDWDEDLLAKAGVTREQFPRMVKPGETVGELSAQFRYDAKCGPIPVVAPATHDTGSAVIGAPIQQDWAYISSGTWSLVGVELPEPIVSDVGREYNFTNEGGAFGTIRLLKNVMGLWILESCRKVWGDDALPYDQLMAQLSNRGPSDKLIEPDEERFLNPDNMVHEINAYLTETGQGACDDQVELCHIIFTSLALKYAQVASWSEVVTGKTVPGIQIVGGGSQNAVLNQATANAAGLPVSAGPVEATALGNAMVQAIAAGRFKDLADARAYIAQHEKVSQFQPTDQSAWQTAKAHFEQLSSLSV